MSVARAMQYVAECDTLARYFRRSRVCHVPVASVCCSCVAACVCDVAVAGVLQVCCGLLRSVAECGASVRYVGRLCVSVTCKCVCMSKKKNLSTHSHVQTHTPPQTTTLATTPTTLTHTTHTHVYKHPHPHPHQHPHPHNQTHTHTHTSTHKTYSCSRSFRSSFSNRIFACSEILKFLRASLLQIQRSGTHTHTHAHSHTTHTHAHTIQRVSNQFQYDSNES